MGDLPIPDGETNSRRGRLAIIQ